MDPTIIVMLVILAVALLIIALVAVGVQSDLRRSSKVADAMGRTAEHLSGDAAPPQAFVDFMGDRTRQGRPGVPGYPARHRPPAERS